MSSSTVVLLISYFLECTTASSLSASYNLNQCALYLKGEISVDPNLQDWGSFFLEFSPDLAEVQVYNSDSDAILARSISDFPMSNLTLKISKNLGGRRADFDVMFVYKDASRSCARVHFLQLAFDGRRNCPSAYDIPCPLASSITLRKPKQCSEANTCDGATCALGACMYQSSAAEVPCQDLYRRDFFSFQTASSSHVHLGFRLTDCRGSMLNTVTANSLIIREGDNNLSPTYTKQQLKKIEGQENFVQLASPYSLLYIELMSEQMISMCSTSLPELDNLIKGLHQFLNNLDLATSRVALTVFDGARGYVDLLLFTKDEDTLRKSFDGLRNYTPRDPSCNLLESISSKFNQLSSYSFGLEWDRVHFLVFTSSPDVAKYVNEEAVTIPLGNADISTYLIALNVPAEKQPQMRAIGRTMYQESDDSRLLGEDFAAIAQQIARPLVSDYILGYCSPARSGMIDTLISWDINKSIVRLQSLRYDSSKFTAGCNASSLLVDYCVTRTTNLEGGAVVCYKGFQSSSATVPASANFVQVLLRYPSQDGVVLLFPFISTRDSPNFDVYIRKGGIANPLLYDMLYTDQQPTYLNLTGSFKSGDLVGVHLDFKTSAYDRTNTIQFGLPPSAPNSQPTTSNPTGSTSTGALRSILCHYLILGVLFLVAF